MFERFTQQARQSVVRTQEEARALKATEILPAHLLLGAVSATETSRTPLAAALEGSGITAAQLRADLGSRGPGPRLGDQDAAALESVGINLDAVRSAVEEQFGPGALDDAASPERRAMFGRRRGGTGGGHIAFSRGAKSVLEHSLREALARKDNYIGVEHILLGVIRGADPTALSLIRENTTPDELAAKIQETMDPAA